MSCWDCDTVTAPAYCPCHLLRPLLELRICFATHAGVHCLVQSAPSVQGRAWCKAPTCWARVPCHPMLLTFPWQQAGICHLPMWDPSGPYRPHYRYGARDLPSRAPLLPSLGQGTSPGLGYTSVSWAPACSARPRGRSLAAASVDQATRVCSLGPNSRSSMGCPGWTAKSGFEAIAMCPQGRLP